MPASLHPVEGPAPRVNSKLLHALVIEQQLSQVDGEAAALYAKRRSLHIEEALLQMGVMDEARLLKFQANYYKTQFVSTQKLSRAPINENLLKLIPHKLATKFCIFPVKYDQRHGVLSILTVEPNDLEVLKNVQFATRVPKVRALVARPAAIQAAIRVHYEDEVQAFGSIRSMGPTGQIATERDRSRTITQTYDQNSLAPHHHGPSSPAGPPPGLSMPVPPSMPPMSGQPGPPPAPMHGMPNQAAPMAAAPMPPVPGVPMHGAPMPPPQTAYDSGALPSMPQPMDPLRQTGGMEIQPFPVGGPPPQALGGSPQALGGGMGGQAGTLLGAASPMVGPSGTQSMAMSLPAPSNQTFGARDTGVGLEVGVPEAPAAKAPAGIALHDYLETLNVLVALLENERGDLRGHSVAVARLCRRFCERLGLKAEEADSIITAAYLHDIGKASAFHLTALNVAQYEQYRQQAKKSYLTPIRIFEGVRLPDHVVSILTHLYERYDGQGFPDRLTGKEISLGARVLAITETYADLTGHAANPFRKRLSAQEAWDALAKYKGKVFDANLVDVFKLVVLGDDLRAKLLADSRRALIVDSDAEETTVLELRLAEHGFEVTIARNANDAENELVNDFDVVISEVDLAPVDGFSLLRRVRESGNGVPFVFLSKAAESDIVQRAFDLGADEFISKPASPDVVALKINRVLDGGRKKKKSGGVSGSLTEMALPDVVQILFHGRKSGRLTIAAGGKRGEILFSEGQIFEATFGEDENEEAFYTMLCLASGDFELDPNFVPSERKIQLNPESLLLEGMRRLDEAGR